MTKSRYLPRYRYPVDIIRIAVKLHMFMPSRMACLLLLILCGVRVSHKSICEWTKKFVLVKLPGMNYNPDQIIICHVDEKYVKVRGKWNYWWTLKDSFGNPLSWLITALRDFASAKKLIKNARGRAGRDANMLVRDGLQAYNKATKYLGRRCKSVVAGIQGKGVIYKKNFYWLTNNPAESLNSEIDFYLSKFQNNFSNINSANRFADIFMLRKYLRKCYMEKKYSEATSTLNQAILF